jgi:hypothetical protein
MTITEARAQPPAPTTTAPLIIDTELGTRSVSGFIQRGEVVVKQAESFKEVEKIVWGIEASKTRPAGVVLDTVTSLASKTSFDVGHESIPKNGIWEGRFNLATTQPQWGVMSTCLILLARVCRSFGVPLIFTAHEGERHDEASGSTLHFPDLNPMLLKDLVQNADAVLRVSRSSTIFESEGKRFPAGSRAIRCSPDEKYYAKIRIPDDAPSAPNLIGNDDPKSWKPAIERLWEIAQGPLHCIVIYGAPGVGKTRLATELVMYYATKTRQTRQESK